MVFEIVIIAVVVALVAAAAAFLANKCWPQLTIRQLMDRVVMSLTAITLVMMVAGCGLVLRTKCAPENHVCDGPAMAAMGVTLLGATILVAIVFVAIPISFMVLKILRRP
jgi:hypothetical protein